MKIPAISAVQVFSSEIISPVAPFLGFFIYIRSSYFQEHMSVCYLFFFYFFYCNVWSKNFLSLFFYFFKKSDTQYLLSTNRLLSIVIDKLIIIEFAILIRNLPFLVPPSTLGEHIYGVSVIFRKGIFQIPPGCLPILHLCDPFCRLDKFALLEFLLSFIFVNIISALQLIFQKIYSHWNESMTALFI